MQKVESSFQKLQRFCVTNEEGVELGSNEVYVESIKSFASSVLCRMSALYPKVRLLVPKGMEIVESNRTEGALKGCENTIFLLA